MCPCHPVISSTPLNNLRAKAIRLQSSSPRPELCPVPACACVCRPGIREDLKKSHKNREQGKISAWLQTMCFDIFRLTMCFDMGIVTCGPNEALVISGMFQGNTPSLLTGFKHRERFDQKLFQLFRTSKLGSSSKLFLTDSQLFSGGRAIVCPGVQTLQRIDLTTMTLEIKYLFDPSIFKLHPFVLWSFDENFKIERALHSVIQLWITCKKTLPT